MSNETSKYESEFSENNFWDKVVNFAKAAGKEVIEKALWLYYAAHIDWTLRIKHFENSI